MLCIIHCNGYGLYCFKQLDVSFRCSCFVIHVPLFLYSNDTEVMRIVKNFRLGRTNTFFRVQPL